MYPLRNGANSENIHENLSFTLATNEKSSRKITKSKYDPIDSKMNEYLGELKAAILGKYQQNQESPSSMHSCMLGQRCFEYLISFVEHSDAGYYGNRRTSFPTLSKSTQK